MSDYTRKNEARREHYRGNDRAHRTARQYRQACNGKFGNQGATTWNRLIVGTSGTTRKGKDKDDAQLTFGGMKIDVQV